MPSMSAVEPLGGLAETPAATWAEASFTLSRPSAGSTPLVFASPHSGRIYPPAMMAASRLDAIAIRRSEDAWVDRLIEGASAHGASVIRADLARVYVDLNRDERELDPTMFAEPLPDGSHARTARVAAGLGAIARVVAEGEEVYARKLTLAEVRQRLEAAHRPYHAALRGLIEETLAVHGVAVLIDWHSMPSLAAAHGAACDVVLGDRFGGACSSAVARAVERAWRDLGYGVVRNSPYAGGYTTEHYGAPGRGVHALQIEINRGLYVDETSLEMTAGFFRLKADLDKLFAALAATDWAALAR